MPSSGIIDQLWTWTPFLLQGFGWNLLIAASASALGTLIGVTLVGMQFSSHPLISRSGEFISQSFYRVPTIALMFYGAFLLPQEFEWPWGGELQHFPAWIKATLALSASPIGFTAQNLPSAVHHWRKGNRGAALLFIPSWCNSLIITIIASSGASLVGVSEIVSRTNKIISALQDSTLLVPLYLYASGFFLLFCYPLTLALRKLHSHLSKQVKLRQDTVCDE